MTIDQRFNELEARIEVLEAELDDSVAIQDELTAALIGLYMSADECNSSVH